MNPTSQNKIASHQAVASQAALLTEAGYGFEKFRNYSIDFQFLPCNLKATELAGSLAGLSETENKTRIHHSHPS